MPVSLSPAAASMLKSKSTVILIAHNGLVNARSCARSRPARRLISLRGTEDGAGGGRCRSCVSPPSLLQRTAHVGGMAIKKRRDLRIESKPFSTISNASGITSRKSGTSKCVKSELNTGRSRKPILGSKAHRVVLSSASQLK
jgi:hypothetical protein